MKDHKGSQSSHQNGNQRIFMTLQSPHFPTIELPYLQPLSHYIHLHPMSYHILQQAVAFTVVGSPLSVWAMSMYVK